MNSLGRDFTSVVDGAGPALRAAQGAEVPLALARTPEECSKASRGKLGEAGYLTLLVDGEGAGLVAAERSEVPDIELLRDGADGGVHRR